jgi:hypothetical protein
MPIQFRSFELLRQRGVGPESLIARSEEHRCSNSAKLTESSGRAIFGSIEVDRPHLYLRAVTRFRDQGVPDDSLPWPDVWPASVLESLVSYTTAGPSA